MLRNSPAEPAMIAVVAATIVLQTILAAQTRATAEHDATASPPSNHETESSFNATDVAVGTKTETKVMAAVATRRISDESQEKTSP